MSLHEVWHPHGFFDDTVTCLWPLSSQLRADDKACILNVSLEENRSNDVMMI